MNLLSERAGARPQTVILDLAGTVFDWPPRCIPSPAYVIRARSADPSHVDLATLLSIIEGDDGSAFAHGSVQESEYSLLQEHRWIRAMEHAGVEPSTRLLMLCKEVMRVRAPRVFPDAVRLLETLAILNIPWNVCSNAAPDILPKVLSQLPATVDQPTQAALSWQVGACKPHPRMFDASTSVSQSAQREHEWFIGDRVHPDLLGPLDAGFSVVHLDRYSSSGARTEGVSLPASAQVNPRFLGTVLDLDTVAEAIDRLSSNEGGRA